MLFVVPFPESSRYLTMTRFAVSKDDVKVYPHGSKAFGELFGVIYIHLTAKGFYMVL